MAKPMFKIGDRVKIAKNGANIKNGGKIHFKDITEHIRGLEYDGDETDLRLHGDESVYWGAKTNAEYKKAIKEIDAIEYKGKGWEIYPSYDVSGFQYWMKNQQEQQYLNLVITFDKKLIDKSELRAIENALEEALEDMRNVSYKYDYVPNSEEMKNGANVKGGSSVSKMVQKLKKAYPSIELREGENRISVFANFPAGSDGYPIFDYYGDMYGTKEGTSPFEFNKFVENNGYVIETQNPDHIILWKKGHYGWEKGGDIKGFTYTIGGL